MGFLILITFLFFVLGFLWFRFRNSSSNVGNDLSSLLFRSMDPLPNFENDPLLKLAHESAKKTIPEFRELFAIYPKNATVKVLLPTPSGKTQTAWGQVLKVSGEEIEIKILSCSKPEERPNPLWTIKTVPVENLIDWAVEVANGKIRGGYTTRAYFNKYREKYGRLKPRDQKQQEKYI